MRSRSFGRRDLLRAAGLTLVVPTFLRDAFADAEAQGPRLVILMQPCGTHPRTFWPDPVSGSSPILEPILLDAALAARTLVIKGVANVTAGLGNEHDRGFNSLWTGVPPVGTPEDCFGGGASIDQILKRELRPPVLFPTLNCGVLAAYVPPKNGHRRSFSYFGPKQQVPTATDPFRLYTALFRSSSSEDSASAARRLAMRRSVLDHSAADLQQLAGRLGPNERRKLDAHTTALREYENRLIASARVGSGLCAAPASPGSAVDHELEDNVPLLAELMLDLVAAALSCNLTRIVTFQLGLSGSQWRYRWLGIDQDSHEEIAHRDTPDGSNVPVAEAMTKISRWNAQNVARFARRLHDTPEAGGTALDSSLVIWANENGNGFHGMDNLPLVFLGRASGRLTKSGVVDAGPQTHHQLNTTVLQLMGVPAPGFGSAPNCGALNGVA